MATQRNPTTARTVAIVLAIVTNIWMRHYTHQSGNKLFARVGPFILLRWKQPIYSYPQRQLKFFVMAGRMYHTDDYYDNACLLQSHHLRYIPASVRGDILSRDINNWQRILAKFKVSVAASIESKQRPLLLPDL